MMKRLGQLVWRRRWPLAVVAGIIVFGVLWWLLPPALYRNAGDDANARLKAVTDTRTALLAGLVGLGALGTFWLNSRVHRITEQGHITDRYAKAIEHLGSETIDVRLGGIYALERIAHDSPRDQDQATIVEVLSAFVRVHSDPVYRLRKDQPEFTPESKEQERELAAKHVEAERLPIDIQAAVTVLGRLPRRAGVSRADLTGAFLRDAQLDRADLTDASLVGADLTDASLVGADLTDAWLTEADLTDAWLRGRT